MSSGRFTSRSSICLPSDLADNIAPCLSTALARSTLSFPTSQGPSRHVKEHDWVRPSPCYQKIFASLLHCSSHCTQHISLAITIVPLIRLPSSATFINLHQPTYFVAAKLVAPAVDAPNTSDASWNRLLSSQVYQSHLERTAISCHPPESPTSLPRSGSLQDEISLLLVTSTPSYVRCREYRTTLAALWAPRCSP